MNKNKAILLVIILVLLFVFGLFLKQRKDNSVKEIPEIENKAVVPISITKAEIKEENFTGSMSAIVGEGELAVEARTFVEQTVSQFKTDADIQVPDMRAEFGADSPSANYTIEIEAKYLKGDKTESIVISTYAYTGGANGNSSYKVVTASVSGGKILALSDIIKADKRVAFTEFLKKELKDWRVEGSSESMLFLDVVEDLSFENLTNWSLDDKNLYIYFSKYEIGPGVLGAFVFPIPKEDIKDLMEPSML